MRVDDSQSVSISPPPALGAAAAATSAAAADSVADVDMNADFSDTDSAFSVDSRVETEKMKRVIAKLKCDLESERGENMVV